MIPILPQMKNLLKSFQNTKHVIVSNTNKQVNTINRLFKNKKQNIVKLLFLCDDPTNNINNDDLLHQHCCTHVGMH